MSTFNQDTVYSNLLRGMKRGRSLSKELKNMPAAIKVRKDEDGKVMVRYYDTDIVTVQGDRVVLNNGGWPTPSTRRYVNAALATLFPGLRMGLTQKNYDQFFSFYDTVLPFYRTLTFNIVNGKLVTI